MTTYYILDNRKERSKDVPLMTDNINPKDVRIYDNPEDCESALMVMGNFSEYRIYKIERDFLNKKDIIKLNPDVDQVAYYLDFKLQQDYRKISTVYRGESFYKRLKEVVPASFHSLSDADQWRHIAFACQLEEDPLFKVFYHDWQVSCVYLKNLAINAGKLHDYNNWDTFKNLIILNEIRKQIPERLQKTLPVNLQQALVLQYIQRKKETAKAKEAAACKPDAMHRTQRIENDQGLMEKANSNNLVCRITLELLKDPVKIGPHYFSKDALIEWLKRKPENPLTHEPLTLAAVEKLPVDTEKKKAVEAFKQECVAGWQEIVKEISSTSNGVNYSNASNQVNNNNNDSNANKDNAKTERKVRFEKK